MKKSTDIRVKRTQIALLLALEELLKTKKLSNITITELCNKAKINRNTFYYHYNNIFELMEEYKNVMIDDMSQVLAESNTHSKQCLINLCKSIKRYPNFLAILLSPNCDLGFFNDIFDFAIKITSEFTAKPAAELTTRELYTCYYSNAGTNEVIRRWLVNGMKESPEEIADIIWNASKNGVFPILFPGEDFK